MRSLVLLAPASVERTRLISEDTLFDLNAIKPQKVTHEACRIGSKKNVTASAFYLAKLDMNWDWPYCPVRAKNAGRRTEA